MRRAIALSQVSFVYASRSLYLKLRVLAALRFLSSGLCSAFQA